MDACLKCHKEPIEFKMPYLWCRYCLARWLSKDIDNMKERDKYYREVLLQLDKELRGE